MDRKPDRPTHYKKNKDKLVGKDYYSLHSLAKEIFPELNDDYAYRKTLKNFKIACELLGVNYDDYKSGSSYHVPTNRKSAFVILIRHVDVFEEGKPFTQQNYDKISKFSQSLIQTKNNIESYFNNNEELGDIEDYGNFYEMFYSQNDTNLLIIHEYKKALFRAIHEDFEFLINKVPSDRLVLYAEEYHKYLTADIKKRSAYIQTLYSLIPKE